MYEPRRPSKTIYAICCFKRLSRSASKKEKIVVPKIELPEEYQEELDRKLRQIKKNDVVTAVFFFKGEYLQKKGWCPESIHPPE